MSIIDGPRMVTSGLILYLDAANTKSYPGSGTTWTDLSGNGNSGTLTNGPTFSSANGGRIVLDGTNDHILVADNSIFDFGTGDFTIDLWVYPLSVAGNPTLVIFRNYYSGANGVLLYAVNGKLSVFGNGTSAAFQESGTSLVANTWNHIVWTRISSTSRLYKNTVQVDSRSFTQSISVNNSVAFGYDTQYSNDGFNGYFSSIKIYSKGLTAAEVAQNFNATRGRFGI